MGADTLHCADSELRIWVQVTGTEALAERLLGSSLTASEIKYAARLLGRPAHYLASQVPEFDLSLNTEMLNSYEGGIERRVIDWLQSLS